MESKRKTRKVRKARSAIPEPRKSEEPHKKELKPTSAEALIRYNGDLVESLIQSKAWTEIVFPLLQESIAGVSGRFTNGRYWHGTLTTNWKDENPVFAAGYQKALMDFNNHLDDFVKEKDRLSQLKKDEELEKKAPLYNPFLDEQETREDVYG